MYLVFYVPYGRFRIEVLNTSAKVIIGSCGHLLTSTVLPGTSEFASVKEWIDVAGVGEYCHVPDGYYSYIVRVS